MENPAEGPASKADLQAFKTDMQSWLRDELKNSATKDDLKPIQTTLDKHTELFVKHTKAIDGVKEDLRKMDQGLRRFISEKADEMARDRDATAAAIEKYELESVRFPNSLDEHGKRLARHDDAIQAHDKRIKQLESKP